MKKEDLKVGQLSESPGVYIFQDSKLKPLYIGRATNLKSRVLSYFNKNLMSARGPGIVEAVEKAKKVYTIPTDSILESFLLEADYIKKFKPKYNVVGKDDSSFYQVVILKEKYPRIILKRKQQLVGVEYKYKFGPFTNGSLLKKALKIIRKIFPFRDKCKIPADGKIGKECFSAQLNLCPGVCRGDISEKEYNENIKSIVALFKGKKKTLLKDLEKQMKKYSDDYEFEKAESVLHKINSLKHINDVALIEQKESYSQIRGDKFRIEAYDISHTGNNNKVGMMVVMEYGEMSPKEYRKFNIKSIGGGDTGALREMLERRFKRDGWEYPKLIVMDGSLQQVNVAKSVLKEYGMEIPIVGVVKDERHRPKNLVGDVKCKRKYEKEILLVNSVVHNKVIGWHRKKRDSLK